MPENEKRLGFPSRALREPFDWRRFRTGYGNATRVRFGRSVCSAAAPGTNSLGTALPSSGFGNGPMNGPLLGTGNPVVDREDAKVAKAMRSICRGC
jgi:hypothetical protein